MNDQDTPIGKAIVTVLGTVSAITLHNVNIWLSTIAAVVSIAVGLLTVCVLIRKLRGKGE